MLEAARTAPVGRRLPRARHPLRRRPVGRQQPGDRGRRDRHSGGERRRTSRPIRSPRRSDVFGPSTSGCLVRRTALAAVGGLEPLYFAYLEDVDVAWRLRKKGYRALVVPGAVALHEGSASTGEGSWLKAFLVARNRRALFRLHGPPRTLGARASRSDRDRPRDPSRRFGRRHRLGPRSRGCPADSPVHALSARVQRRAGIPDDAQVALAPRRTLHEALRRKRAAESLMSRGDGRCRATSRGRRRAAPHAPDGHPADGR